MTRSSDSPFFRPLWRRVAVLVVSGAWAALEFYAQAPFWGVIALGFLVYGYWSLIHTYNPPPEGTE